LSEPLLGKLPIQECFQFIVDNLWHSYMLKTIFSWSWSCWGLNTTTTCQDRQVGISCTLVVRVEITSKTCMQEEITFWFALYNGVHLIIVWLLLSYQ
jgi:hypothetical protein